jgi:hypothetical protein
VVAGLFHVDADLQLTSAEVNELAIDAEVEPHLRDGLVVDVVAPGARI